MPEKRRFARLGIKVPIKWKIISTSPTDVASMLDITKNISRGGICFSVGKKLNKGTLLFLEIKLPTNKVIKARARVVWINEVSPTTAQAAPEYYAGVEFLDILEADKDEINKFVFEFMIHPGE